MAKEEAVDANHNHQHAHATDCAAPESSGEHCGSKTERKSHHSDKMKANLTTRLNRIEGQIRGVKAMIDKDTYCDDVLNQIAAAQSALNSVGKLLLEGHMKSCIVERIQAGENEVIDELLTTVQKLMK
ncbi:metal-sensitive transcriptional regulator [Paenibacillus sp. YIM B09110]|uniref:metal-sensitive transcriptional regulator n=1 Tax=Paenibacillus sp. YIM B09110 TaxID=3126102 RepID=UPI00301B73DB